MYSMEGFIQSYNMLVFQYKSYLMHPYNTNNTRFYLAQLVDSFFILIVYNTITMHMIQKPYLFKVMCNPVLKSHDPGCWKCSYTHVHVYCERTALYFWPQPTSI